MALLYLDNPRFKKVFIISAISHLILFIGLYLSPHLPSFKKKGTIFYVDLANMGGGNGGSSSAVTIEKKTEEITETNVSSQSLKDLTISDNLLKTEPKLHHPVKKPEKEVKKKPDKKAVISNTSSKPAQKKKASGQQGSGGIQIGGSSTGEGGGIGSGGGGNWGLSDFPYSYYIEQVRRTIAGNWFKSQLRSGISGRTIVSVEINQDGSMKNPTVLESCGSRTLDNSARRAVIQSTFPPLPSSFEDESIIFRFVFEHKK